MHATKPDIRVFKVGLDYSGLAASFEGIKLHRRGEVRANTGHIVNNKQLLDKYTSHIYNI